MEENKETVEVTPSNVKLEDLSKLTPEDFKIVVGEVFESKLKEMGVDKTDIKYKHLPQIEGEKEVNFVEDKNLNQTTEVKQWVRGIFNKTFLSETNSDGGYTVPTPIVAQVDKLIASNSYFYKMASRFDMDSKSITVPNTTTIPGFTFFNEKGTIISGSAVYDKVTLERHNAGFVLPLSNDLLEDSAVNLVTELGNATGMKWANFVDNAGFYGNVTAGVSGVSGSSGVISVTNNVSVSGSTFFTAAKLKQMQNINAAGANSPDNAYFMDFSTLSAIETSVTGSGLESIVKYDQSYNPYIFGKRVYITGGDASSTVITGTSTDTAGTIYVFYGNLKNAYLGLRKDLQYAFSDSAYAYGISAFVQNSFWMRAMGSLDVKCPFGQLFSMYIRA